MCLVTQAIWDPRLAFTGTTILGVNPENGQHQFQTCSCCHDAQMWLLHCSRKQHKLIASPFFTGISCRDLPGGPFVLNAMLFRPEGESPSEESVCLQASSISMWMPGTQTRTTSFLALRVSCLFSSRSGTSASPATWPHLSSASSRSTRSMRSAGSASLFAL